MVYFSISLYGIYNIVSYRIFHTYLELQLLDSRPVVEWLLLNLLEYTSDDNSSIYKVEVCKLAGILACSWQSSLFQLNSEYLNTKK
jgi:hypothetical protein